MELRGHQLSIVVLAGNHNPSLLNPDFLKRQGVVPESWKVEGQPITTPAFSTVQFAEGVQIVSTPDRLDIRATWPESFGTAGDPARIASAYVETLPHVPYRALGVNPTFALEPPEGTDPQDAVRGLLAEGPWRQPEATVVVEATWPFEGAQLRLKLAAEAGLMLFEVNLHQERPEEPGDQGISWLVDELGRSPDKIERVAEMLRGEVVPNVFRKEAR